MKSRVRARAASARDCARGAPWEQAPSFISCVPTRAGIRSRASTGRRRRAAVQLVTREFNEDQHLDILIALDAGRFSRVRPGRLDRLGLYANIAARFAQIATPNDDRVGLVVFADRPLAVCAPERGLRAIARLHENPCAPRRAARRNRIR